MGGRILLPGKARPSEGARLDRPVAAERHRLIAGSRASVRGHRRPDRGDARQAARRERVGARADLDLRSRRPGTRCHPGSRVSDWYQQFTTTAPGRIAARRLGLPRPAILRRYRPGQPLLEGPALVGGASGGRLAAMIASLLKGAGADVRGEPPTQPSPAGGGRPADHWGAIVFDATGIAEVGQLAQLHAFLAPAFRNLGPCGRLLLLGTTPESCREPARAAAQPALDGFVRAAAQEARARDTRTQPRVAEDADHGIESTVRFF